tara:strand:- start:165 stop:368 length:204 start_codon:yes stop_codon:yes gene_type:complete
MLSSLFFSFVSLSLNETINTNRLNKIKTIRKNKKFKLVRIAKYSDDKINTNEIKKTRYLNTAIIDRE